MSLMKIVALGVMALGATAGTCSAGSISSNTTSSRWSWWDSSTGTFATMSTATAVPSAPFVPIPASTTPTPMIAAASAPAFVPSAGLITQAVSSSPRWASVTNAATAYASTNGGVGPAPANPPPSQPTYNAFINMGNGPYPNASGLATGNPQPWYNSPQIVGLFGGQPNAQQRADFTSTVLQRVEQTYASSGVAVSLTTDPNALASHTLSVVSNASSAAISSTAIGLTYVGANGFAFIDQAAKLAGSVDQLEWIVAHNVSHELMLAFGVGENYDKSGNFIDAGVANLSMLLSPNAAFSQGAAQALNGQGLGDGVATTSPAAQVVGPAAVPEPTTLVLWAVALGGAVAIKGRRRARASA